MSQSPFAFLGVVGTKCFDIQTYARVHTHTHMYNTSGSCFAVYNIVDNLCEYELNYTYLYIRIYTFARMSVYANMR